MAVYDVHCPACGKFQKEVKGKREISRQEFKCSCGQKFSLIFPGNKKREKKKGS